MAKQRKCPHCSFSQPYKRLQSHMRTKGHGWPCPASSCKDGPWRIQTKRDNHVANCKHKAGGHAPKPIPQTPCTHIPYQCLLCGDLAPDVKTHMKQNHTVCMICNASCPSEKTHNDHYRILHPYRFCTRCERPWAAGHVAQRADPGSSSYPQAQPLKLGPVTRSMTRNANVSEAAANDQLPLLSTSPQTGDTTVENEPGIGPPAKASQDSPTISQTKEETDGSHNPTPTVAEVHAAELSAMREAMHRLELELASVRETRGSTACAPGKPDGLPKSAMIECGDPQAPEQSQVGNTFTEDMRISGASSVFPSHKEEVFQSTSSRESSPSSGDVCPIVPSLPNGLDSESDSAQTRHIPSERATMDSEIYAHKSSGDVAHTAEAKVASTTCSDAKPKDWEAVSITPPVSDLSYTVDYDDDFPYVMVNDEDDIRSASPSTISLIECGTSDIDLSEHLSVNAPSVDHYIHDSGSCGTVPSGQENDAGFEPRDLSTRTTPLPDRFSCKLCSEEPMQPTVTMCGHLFCHDCIVREMSKNLRCPVCHTVMLVHLKVD